MPGKISSISLKKQLHLPKVSMEVQRDLSKDKMRVNLCLKRNTFSIIFRRTLKWWRECRCIMMTLMTLRRWPRMRYGGSLNRSVLRTSSMPESSFKVKFSSLIKDAQSVLCSLHVSTINHILRLFKTVYILYINLNSKSIFPRKKETF